MRGGGGGGVILKKNSSKQPLNKNKILTWSSKPNIIYAKKLGKKLITPEKACLDVTPGLS